LLEKLSAFQEVHGRKRAEFIAANSTGQSIRIGNTEDTEVQSTERRLKIRSMPHFWANGPNIPISGLTCTPVSE
jgi:hypothetical protein